MQIWRHGCFCAVPELDPQTRSNQTPARTGLPAIFGSHPYLVAAAASAVAMAASAFAERIRRETGIITRAVGLIDDPKVADDILSSGRADLVAMARAMLADPRWPWRAAKTLGEPLLIVPQYLRSASLVK